MTRDRPASGGTDSTLEGEFPSDLGGGTARGSPLKTTQLSSELSVNQPGSYQAGTFPGKYIKQDPVNILAINNYPIDGSLSGIYYFSSDGGNLPDPFFGTTSTLFTTGLTVNGTSTVDLGSVSVTGYKPGGFTVFMSFAPTTGSLSPPAFPEIRPQIKNLSATFFDTYRNQDQAGMYGLFTTITSASPASLSAQFPPIPNYVYTYKAVDAVQNVGQPVNAVRPFIPNTDTTFGMDLYINMPTAVSISAFATIQQMTTPSPDATIKSSL